MKRLSNTMSPKRPPLKKSKESIEKPIVEIPEVALAAVASYRRQKEVSDFINFMLEALERNSNWLNNVVDKQSNFRCALMVGAGPNRFQLQEIIYPSGDNEINLEVEMTESEDHNKIAIAALMKMSNLDIDLLMKYIKTRMIDNPILNSDLQKGKALGISFAVLRPVSDKQYRVMERIAVNSTKFPSSVKKRRQEEKLLSAPPVKKTRRVS